MDKRLARAIVASLTPDLLKGYGEWKHDSYWKVLNKRNRLAGHCYAASEAYYRMAGGKRSGLVPQCLKVLGEEAGVKPPDAAWEGKGWTVTHWFLKRGKEVIDLTAGQFKVTPDYSKAVGCGFLTRGPSKRAAELMRRARARLNAGGPRHGGRGASHGVPQTVPVHQGCPEAGARLPRQGQPS